MVARRTVRGHRYRRFGNRLRFRDRGRSTIAGPVVRARRITAVTGLGRNGGCLSATLRSLASARRRRLGNRLGPGLTGVLAVRHIRPAIDIRATADVRIAVEISTTVRISTARGIGTADGISSAGGVSSDESTDGSVGTTRLTRLEFYGRRLLGDRNVADLNIRPRLPGGIAVHSRRTGGAARRTTTAPPARAGGLGL